MNWLNYFQRRREMRVSINWAQEMSVEPPLRKPLIRSLQRFQVGEQGDGAHILAHAAATGDSAYAEAVALFIGEEQEHARMLAMALARLDAPLLRWHWSNTGFTLIRRMMGLKTELMVLLIAEMIAKRYYRALDEGVNTPALRQIFRQIRDDEEGHIAFHCDTLRAAFTPQSPVQNRLIQTTWRGLFRAFCHGVAWDHASVLRAVGVLPSQFRRDCLQIFDATAARIFVSVSSRTALRERQEVQ